VRQTAPVLLLVPSPLLGPATWRPVETWLRDQGHETHTVDFGPSPRTPARVLDAVAAAAVDQAVVLVPHSNAGLYAPHLATLIDVRVTVYVDAALPHPASEGHETSLAPPALLEFLRGLADSDGVLPPWTQWWDDVADLFPDISTRTAVEHEQVRLPLTYFTSRVPVPSGWTERPAAYLAFGDTYADERGLATRTGWPTRTIAGGHLQMLHDPGAVGGAVLDLSREALP
jgi:hypothetical protein